MKPGARITVHAVVERCVGDTIEVRVGNGVVQVVTADIADLPPARVRWCGNPWTVIGQDGSRLGIRRDTIRLWVPAGECTPIISDQG